MKLRFLLAGIGCALLLVALPSARADQVRSAWNHNVNFARFHTCSWGKVRLEQLFNRRRIENLVNDQLRQKGWKELPAGGQVMISVTDRVHSEKQLQTYYDHMADGWGMGWGWGGWGWDGWGAGGLGDTTTTAQRVPVDHLVIDMFNAKTKQLIWRGISRGEMRNHPNQNRKMIYKDMRDLLASFPPQAKK